MKRDIYDKQVAKATDFVKRIKTSVAQFTIVKDP